jgi:cytochrome P450
MFQPPALTTFVQELLVSAASCVQYAHLLVALAVQPDRAAHITWQLVRSGRGPFVSLRLYGFFGPRVFLVRDATVARIILAPANRCGAPGARFGVRGRAYMAYRDTVQNSGDDPHSWAGPRRRLLPFMAQQLTQTAPALVKEVFRREAAAWCHMSAGGGRGIPLHDAMLKAVLHGQCYAFFRHTVEEHSASAATPATFTDVCSRLVNGSRHEMVTHEEKAWFYRIVRDMLAGSPDDSLGGLLRTADELSEDMAVNNAAMFTLALTPAFAMFWTLLSMLRHGEALARARHELERSSGLYLRACIKEAMRLFSPVPQLIERTVLEDTELEGVFMPAGSLVMVSPSWLVTDMDFAPERWLDLGPSDLWRKRFDDVVYFPFGTGNHECMGRFYAAKMVEEVLSLLLLDYDLSLVGDDKMAGLDPPLQRTPHLTAYNRPSSDVFVQFHRRASSVSETASFAAA